MCKKLREFWNRFNGVKPKPYYNVPFATDFELEMLRAINRYRLTRGLIPLVFSKEAHEQAYLHSNFMAGEQRMTHDDFNIRVSNLFHTAKTTVVRENVSAGFNTISSILYGWENSPEHKENLEATDVSRFSVCTIVDDNRVHWTTLILIK